MFRVYNFLILLSFFLCYVSYGKAGDGFIGVTEYAVLAEAESAKDFFAGLLFLSPMVIGQLALLVAICKKSPNKKWTVTGIIFLGLVVFLVAIINLITFSPGILSTAPFLVCSLLGYAQIKRKASKFDV